METASRPMVEACIDCGKPFNEVDKQRRRQRCVEHAKAHRLEISRTYQRSHREQYAEAKHARVTGRRQAKRDNADGNKVMEIVCDPRPVEEGGFAPGAQFEISAIRDIVWQPDYLLDGTQIRNRRTNKLYIVQGRALRPA